MRAEGASGALGSRGKACQHPASEGYKGLWLIQLLLQLIRRMYYHGGSNGAQVFGVAGISGLGAWIAYRQSRIASAKLNLDLYDRRFKVFEAARTCLVFALQKATVTQEVMNAFHLGVADAVFLFDSDIEEYLEKFRKQMTLLQMINYSMSNVGPDEHERRGQLADKLAAQVELVNKELPVLIEKFKPYLKLGNI